MVLGGSGLVGERILSALQSSGYSLSFTYHGHAAKNPHAEGYHLDASDASALSGLLASLKPELVVNAVALPSVDQCDKDPETAFAVNSNPQQIIAAEARRTGLKSVFISTSNVFGPSTNPHTEADKTGPISTYGRTKLQAEQYTLSAPNSIILRTDQIYGWTKSYQKRTFVERTIQKLEGGQKVEVCADWWNCPTYADDIASALVLLLSGEHSGIFHTVGPTFLNRYDWALKIADIFGCDRSLVRSIDSSVLKLPALRPNCALSNAKIIKTVQASFLSVEQGLMLMKKERGVRNG